MSYKSKVVLNCLHGYSDGLDEIVEEFIAAGVKFVGVVGKDCSKVEEIIHELLVGDGSEERFILTASHENESLKEAIDFANELSSDYGDEVQIVELAQAT